MDIGTNPYLSATERDAAIGEYNTIREIGETSQTTLTATMEIEGSAKPDQEIRQQETRREEAMLSTQNKTSEIRQYDQGIKRKSIEDANEEEATPSKRLETEHTDKGLVVLLKPLKEQ